MKITKETDYAIRALIFLAQCETELMDAKAIAEHQVIPQSFMFKVLRKLVAKDLVLSIRGAGGGYKLAKSPEEITLLDIICAIEEEATLNGCLGEAGTCSLWAKKGYCKAHQELLRVQNVLHQELQKKSLAEIMNA